MRIEQVDRRILGTARIVDATTSLPVSGPISVEASGARLVRSRSGVFVVVGAPGFEEYTGSFQAPPPAPAIGSVPVELTVRDLGRRYLPRRSTLRLPRDPDPARADQSGSLFRPVDVPLFPSPAAVPAPGWAVIRATVTDPGGGRLGGALMRVLRTSDGAHLASGLSDTRGEALVVVAGIPVTTWDEGEGSVLVSDVEVTLQAIFDPAAGERVPDPDDLEARRGSLPSSSTVARLASGRTLILSLSVTLL